ncbi:MAG: TPM domain-containing protein [Acinetobacter sp.]|jgi:uncharacterized protein|nr:MAG: TPM domain-containing protein [Acinetobacter sp.]
MLRKIWQVVLIFWVCTCLSIWSVHSYAETATATTDSDDAVVMGNIIKQQADTAAQATTQTAQPTASVVVPQAGEPTEPPTLPQLNQPIIDPTHILTSEQQQQLSQHILKMYQAGQAQIGIVIVPSTGQQDIFSYALNIAEQWQLGTAKHDHGLLLVVAVNDRRMQILTGYGLEGVLPDIVAHQIIQNHMTPYFKQGQYADGLQAGITEIERILSLDPEIARQAAERLKEQQAAALRHQEAVQNTLFFSLFILAAAVIFSKLWGRKISAFGAGFAGIVLGLVNGLGLFASGLIGLGLFFLIISTIAQAVMQGMATSSGGGRSSGGGFGGGSSGGGYSGGGGRFGGGGASGSW